MVRAPRPARRAPAWPTVAPPPALLRIVWPALPLSAYWARGARCGPLRRGNKLLWGYSEEMDPELQAVLNEAVAAEFTDDEEAE